MASKRGHRKCDRIANADITDHATHRHVTSTLNLPMNTTMALRATPMANATAGLKRMASVTPTSKSNTMSFMCTTIVGTAHATYFNESHG